MKRNNLMILVCIVLAVLIGIIGMTTFSFSWFEPDTKEGVGLQFNDSAKLRAENCTFETFSGTLNGKYLEDGETLNTNFGIVTYSDTKLSSGNVTVSATTSNDTTTPGIAYYKTVITNENTDKDTVVSLYLKNFTVNTGSSASIGVAVPTNSYRTYTSAQTDLHIVRNAYISYQIQNEARAGEIVVEWFVKCDSGSVTFNPGDLYLMYS